MNYLLLRFAAETRVLLLLLLFFHELLYVDIGKTLARQATPDSPECVTIMLLASVLVNLTSEKEGQHLLRASSFCLNVNNGSDNLLINA